MRSLDQSDSECLVTKFGAFIEAEGFPCVGAKAALNQEAMRFHVCRSLASEADDRALLAALYRFIADYRASPTLFTSFVALFGGPRELAETEFEALLWRRLEALHRLDRERYDWDPRVSANPRSPKFSFSLMGEACFVVGLHDQASRRARRFETPALVFNIHQQFEELRADGRFEPMRDTIRRRDAEYDATPNPMLASFGDRSEAAQYSGRLVGAAWRCPFQPRPREDAAA